jgi:aspartate/tyrosine/aromatic aminotransferase
MNLFELVKAAPPDPILGLTEAFKADPRPSKINLGVGVFQDASGRVPVLRSVQEAERRLALAGASKSYLPIAGHPDYIRLVQQLTFATGHDLLEQGCVASVQTPGGTGGLRLVAEFIRRALGQRTVWLSNPTWANHASIFAAADLRTNLYPYFDGASNSLNLAGLITVLENIPDNDVVLFHGCCHNPSGVDPSADDWETIAKICKVRHLLPLVDFAYQGFGDGMVSDAAALRAFAEYGLEHMVVTSYSKNFGLYAERVGALHVVAKNRQEAANVLSQLKVMVRTNWSNPPAHGARIVATILGDRDLRLDWEEEVRGMRDHIRAMRSLFIRQLRASGIQRDFSFLEGQRGMFSFSGLSPEQVDVLQAEYAVYMVRSGRINVAGITPSNVEPLCAAIKAVL